MWEYEAGDIGGSVQGRMSLRGWSSAQADLSRASEAMIQEEKVSWSIDLAFSRQSGNALIADPYAPLAVM